MRRTYRVRGLMAIHSPGSHESDPGVASATSAATAPHIILRRRVAGGKGSPVGCEAAGSLEERGEPVLIAAAADVVVDDPRVPAGVYQEVNRLREGDPGGTDSTRFGGHAPNTECDMVPRHIAVSPCPAS